VGDMSGGPKHGVTSFSFIIIDIFNVA